jgi:hypothetical protein
VTDLDTIRARFRTDLVEVGLTDRVDDLSG